MAEFPIMQLMTDAYLGDTRHLTTTEHGAYFLLLMAMWRSGGTLPLDDRFIMRTAGLTSGQWQRMRLTILSFMRPVAGDRFTQPKLLESLKAVRRHSQSQSDRARARWLKIKGLPHAVAEPGQYHGNANHNKIVLSCEEGSFQSPEEGGSATKKATSQEEEIIVSPGLAARYTNGRSH